MSATRTQYARSGDASIAYQTLGDGPLNLAGGVLNRSFINNAVTTWTGFSINGSGTWSNQSGALFDIRWERGGSGSGRAAQCLACARARSGAIATISLRYLPRRIRGEGSRQLRAR